MGDIAGQVEDAWPSVAQRWPGLSLSADRLVAHVESLPPEARTASLDLVDLALACACSDGDPVALRHFETEMMSRAERPIRRIESSASFVDEVVQALRVHLLVGGEGRPRIADYAGRGPLVAWVCVAAVRMALNTLRAQQRADRFSDERWASALVLPETGDPEQELLKQRYADELRQALIEACQSLTDRERSVLRMYFAGGVGIDKIGKVYGVHRSTVARWISRARDTIRTRAHEVLQTSFAIPPQDLDSLDRLARSLLELSFAELL